MTASIIIILCCLGLAIVCHVRIEGADGRKQWWRGFFATLPIGLVMIPIGHACAAPLANYFTPDSGGYTTIVGVETDKETPIFLAWMIVGIAMLTWPVAFKLVRVRPTPRGFLCGSLALTAGHMVGWRVSDIILRLVSLGPYTEAADAAAGEGAFEIVFAVLVQASWFLSICLISTIAVWLLVRRGGRILPFLVTITLSTVAMFPVIMLPGRILPGMVQQLVQQYVLFLYAGQSVATAFIAVAGLTWVATRPDEDPVHF